MLFNCNLRRSCVLVTDRRFACGWSRSGVARARQRRTFRRPSVRRANVGGIVRLVVGPVGMMLLLLSSCQRVMVDLVGKTWARVDMTPCTPRVPPYT